MIVKNLYLVLFLFLIISCNKEDDISSVRKCGEVLCLNGAECVDNTCDCPLGYSGATCNVLLTPSRIFVRKLSVTNFPEKDPLGQNWDPDELPDIFFQFFEDTDILYTELKTHDNAIHTEDYVFLPIQLEITNVNTVHRILLRDFDFSEHDILGEVVFTPFDGKSLPKEIILGAGEDVTFELEVDYAF